MGKIKLGIFLTFAAAFFFTMPVPVVKAASISGPLPVPVTMTPNISDPQNKTDIRLEWPFTTGDILAKSTDGNTWTVLNPTIGTGTASYSEQGVPNWSILYFQITNGTSRVRIDTFPPDINAHANYANDTNMCKYCHITHNAPRPKLLRGTSTSDLCFTCHGFMNTGSRYNVYNGAVISAGPKDPVTGLVTVLNWQKSLGGPYNANTMGVWGQDGSGQNSPVTSSHPLDMTGPGGECLSCHDSHDRNNNYRLLISNDATVIDAYAVNPMGDAPERPNYLDGMNKVCFNCHTYYMTPTGSGHISTWNNNTFQHSVGVTLSWNGQSADGNINLTTTLPLEGTPGKIMCITCHLPHGTVSSGLETGSVSGYLGPGTRLKRKDNRAICEDCHKK